MELAFGRGINVERVSLVRALLHANTIEFRRSVYRNILVASGIGEEYIGNIAVRRAIVFCRLIGERHIAIVGEIAL